MPHEAETTRSSDIEGRRSGWSLEGTFCRQRGDFFGIGHGEYGLDGCQGWQHVAA